jgi:hypothetical protein
MLYRYGISYQEHPWAKRVRTSLLFFEPTRWELIALISGTLILADPALLSFVIKRRDGS